MSTNTTILKNYFYWFLTFIFICLYGITHASAAEYFTTYDDIQIYYDNNGSLTRLGGSWNESLQAYVSPNFTTTAGSYGGFVLFNSPIPIIQNHTYTLVFNFEQKSNIALSYKSNLSIGRYQSDVINAYNNSTYNATSIQKNILNNTIIQYVFKANANAGYIGVPWTTTTTVNQNYVLNSISIEDLGSEGVSEQTINNSLNNQTNILNNSILSSQNAIIDNQNANNQAVIDNNNTNTDKIIESNKENFQTCRDSVNLVNLTNGSGSGSGITAVWKDGAITLNGTATANVFFSFNIDLINAGTIVSISANNTAIDSNVGFRLKNSDTSNTGGTSPLNTINRVKENYEIGNDYNQFQIRIASGAVLNNFTFKPQLEIGTVSTPWEKYGSEVCVNKLDEQNKTSKGILGKLGDLFNWFTNNDSPDLNSASNVAGFLPPGPVDSIINLPVTMLLNINTSLSKTCSPLNITLPYVNKVIPIPCLNEIFSQITGLTAFWSWVGIISSVLILYTYLINLYNYFDRLTDLQANFMSDWGSV